eukprot:TRINITY_DN29580_c0_g1_i1.p1 TRINITY_DN29580_c0_g1~~TRINITY_DN29580_c0_g1_i1.p1  ORF type:complete len:265 (+),score=43.58 TRINITY_DN29580_c0_g1_i1:76-795(+)
MAALPLFVRVPAGDLLAVEVPADAVAGDILAALPPGVAPAGASLHFQGEALTLSRPVADCGLAAQAALELRSPVGWLKTGPEGELSTDRMSFTRREKNRRADGRCFALGPAATAGQLVRFRARVIDNNCGLYVGLIEPGFDWEEVEKSSLASYRGSAAVWYWYGNGIVHRNRRTQESKEVTTQTMPKGGIIQLEIDRVKGQVRYWLGGSLKATLPLARDSDLHLMCQVEVVGDGLEILP